MWFGARDSTCSSSAADSFPWRRAPSALDLSVSGRVKPLMSQTILYICEPGAVLARRGQRLLVRKDSRLLLEIPLREIATVALFGPVQVTTQALGLLFRHGIGLAFLSLQGQFRGRLAPALNSNAAVRLSQYEAARDPVRQLALARPLVQAKLAQCVRLIAAYRKNYPDAALAQAQQALAGFARQAQAAGSLQQLLGCEGRAARIYFQALARLNRSGLAFAGRRRRPPADPVNALLSLGYTLATAELLALAEARGLDPYIGFLHQLRPGRPSLALDLVEPFRPALADRLTLRLVNERILKAEHFHAQPDAAGRMGVRLTPEGLRRYLAEYGEALAVPERPGGPSLRQEMIRQVDRLADALAAGGDWVAFEGAGSCTMW